MLTCGICQSTAVERILELGPQPVSTHFGTTPGGAVVEHNLDLAVCNACGTVQIARPFPAADLVPPFDWISYREPEAHLDAVVDKVCAMANLGPKSVVAGVSWKDKSMLERVERKGFGQVWLIDPIADLGITTDNANIESIQHRLTPDAADGIVSRRGPVDVLLVRHILEHTENPRNFMQALSTLLAPGGYLVIEVPDCTSNLLRQDYTMIWEEHSMYFTPDVLPGVLEATQCTLQGLEVHPYAFEDVILLYGRKTPHAAGSSGAAVQENVARALAYGQAFRSWTRRYRDLFSSMTAGSKPLAAYGAGHLTCAFLNFHGLSEFFAFVVDDTPEKQGLYLPRSDLPIVSRRQLDEAAVATCLLGLSPDIEDKIIANNRPFTELAGRFYSMFVDSERSIRHLLHAR